MSQASPSIPLLCLDNTSSSCGLLNAALQFLFSITPIRDAILHWSPREGLLGRGHVDLGRAVQELFLQAVADLPNDDATRKRTYLSTAAIAQLLHQHDTEADDTCLFTTIMDVLCVDNVNEVLTRLITGTEEVTRESPDGVVVSSATMRLHDVEMDPSRAADLQDAFRDRFGSSTDDSDEEVMACNFSLDNEDTEYVTCRKNMRLTHLSEVAILHFRTLEWDNKIPVETNISLPPEFDAACWGVPSGGTYSLVGVLAVTRGKTVRLYLRSRPSSPSPCTTPFYLFQDEDIWPSTFQCATASAYWNGSALEHHRISHAIYVDKRAMDYVYAPQQQLTLPGRPQLAPRSVAKVHVVTPRTLHRYAKQIMWGFPVQVDQETYEPDIHSFVFESYTAIRDVTAAVARRASIPYDSVHLWLIPSFHVLYQGACYLRDGSVTIQELLRSPGATTQDSVLTMYLDIPSPRPLTYCTNALAQDGFVLSVQLSTVAEDSSPNHALYPLNAAVAATTNPRARGPQWWRVTFQYHIPFYRFVFHRQEDRPSLQGVRVVVERDGAEVWSSPLMSETLTSRGSVVVVDANNAELVGDCVRIEKPDGGVLSLSEVSFFTSPMESPLSLGSVPASSHLDSNRVILFVKIYHPGNQSMTFLGTLAVERHAYLWDYFPQISHWAHCHGCPHFETFIEESPGVLEVVASNLPLRHTSLWDGGVLVIQVGYRVLQENTRLVHAQVLARNGYRKRRVIFAPRSRQGNWRTRAIEVPSDTTKDDLVGAFLTDLGVQTPREFIQLYPEDRACPGIPALTPCSPNVRVDEALHGRPSGTLFFDLNSKIRTDGSDDSTSEPNFLLCVSYGTIHGEIIYRHIFATTPNQTVNDLIQAVLALPYPTSARVDPATPHEMLSISRHEIVEVYNREDPVPIDRGMVEVRPVPPRLRTATGDIIEGQQLRNLVHHCAGAHSSPIRVWIAPTDTWSSAFERLVAELNIPASHFLSPKSRQLKFLNPSTKTILQYEGSSNLLRSIVKADMYGSATLVLLHDAGSK